MIASGEQWVKMHKTEAEIGIFFCLTIPRICDIINKSPKAAPTKSGQTKSHEKNFEKSFEKGLTNDLKCGIINKLSRRTADREWKPGQVVATAS